MEIGSGGAELRLRKLTEQDIPFAMELKNIAKWNQTPDCWRGYLIIEPDGCFLAEWNGEKAGTATAVAYESRFGWVGMVLVHPGHRRHGIGTTLLERAIRYLQDTGTGCVKLDATPMGRHVYVPLGFRDEYEVHRYEGTGIRMIGKPEPNGFEPAAEPLTAVRMDEVIAFDAERFGAGRGAVLRALHIRNPEYCFCESDERGISGYLMAHEGYEAVQLGPWVARNADTADRLLRRILFEIGDRPVFLDIPAPNREAVTLMEKYGFRFQRGFYRMFLGENRTPGIPEQVYGTSGAEKG